MGMWIGMRQKKTPTIVTICHQKPLISAGDQSSNAKRIKFMDRIIECTKWSKNRWLIFGSGFAVVCLILIIFSFTNEGARINVDASRLNIASVSKGNFQESIPLDGTVQPLKSIYIALAEAGRVEERFVDEGQLVEAGAPLLRLSNPELQLELMNREEILANERTQLVNAGFSKDKSLLNLLDQLADQEHQLGILNRTWKQDSTLFQSNAVSKNEYQTALESYSHALKKYQILKDKYARELENSNAQIQQYAASVQLKQKNLNLVRSNYEMLTVKAPAHGQLTAFKAEVGEFKNKGENLGQLDIPDGYKVRASIDEHYLPKVNIGQTALFEFNGAAHSLKVDVIYPQVKNGRFEADLTFIQETPREIRKGQTVQLRLNLGSSQTALQLPRSAYMQKTGGNWVYVLNPKTQTAEKRNIRTGRQNNDSIEILEGLNEGEQVIISSYDSFGESPILVLKNKE